MLPELPESYRRQVADLFAPWRRVWEIQEMCRELNMRALPLFWRGALGRGQMPCEECEEIRKNHPGALCGSCAGVVRQTTERMVEAARRIYGMALLIREHGCRPERVHAILNEIEEAFPVLADQPEEEIAQAKLAGADARLAEAGQAMDEAERAGGDAPHRAVSLGARIRVMQQEVERLRAERCSHGWRGGPADAPIVTPCPTCGGRTLFIGTGGHLTCSWVPSDYDRGCPEPGVERAIEKLKARLALWESKESLPDCPACAALAAAQPEVKP